MGQDLGKKTVPWTQEEFFFGRYLLRDRHPVLKEYLARELRIREKILARFAEEETLSGEAIRRKKEVEEEKRQILAALKQYEGK